MSSSTEQCSASTPHTSADAGWAVKKARRATRFSDKVKLYLRDIFLKGEETGKKANPADISSKMKNARSEETGKKVCSKEEWLTTQQVASYFSRLTVLDKSGRLRISDDQASEVDEEELRNETEEMACEVIREEIRRQIEL